MPTYNRFDATLKSNRFDCSVVGFTRATVSIKLANRTSGGTQAVYTFERSTDGKSFDAMQGSVPDITGEGITDALDVEGFSVLRVKVKTADSQANTKATISIALSNPNQVPTAGLSNFRDLLNQGPQTMPGGGLPISE